MFYSGFLLYHNIMALLDKICKFIQIYNDKSFYLLYNYL
nr:MAG TPA: hypothetical protein [Caudoviricetes sp.]